LKSDGCVLTSYLLIYIYIYIYIYCIVYRRDKRNAIFMHIEKESLTSTNQSNVEIIVPRNSDAIAGALYKTAANKNNNYKGITDEAVQS